MSRWREGTGIVAALAVALGAMTAPARPVQAEDAVVRADLLQVTVGDTSTFYAVIINNDDDEATIDVRIAVPAGSEILATYAGVPGENEGAYGDNEIGWINTGVPPNGQAFGPFAVTMRSPDAVKCTQVRLYYNTGDTSGTYVSQELCTTSFMSSTGGYTQPTS